MTINATVRSNQYTTFDRVIQKTFSRRKDLVLNDDGGCGDAHVLHHHGYDVSMSGY